MNYNITRENDELVLRLPLKQQVYNCYDNNSTRMTDNLIGVVAGREYTLSQLVDLSYKDTQQEGMPILYFATREELEEVCKRFDIQIWDHPVCTYPKCGEVLRGVMGYGDNGVECCEHSEYNKDR